MRCWKTFRAHFEVVRSYSLSKGRSSHPGDLFVWKSEGWNSCILDERIGRLGVVEDSPLKPKLGLSGPPAMTIKPLSKSGVWGET